MVRILIAIAAVAVVGCGPKKPDGRPVAAEPDAGATAVTEEDLPPTLVTKVERAVTLVEALVVAAEQSDGDCEKMAIDLQAIADGPEGQVVIEMDLDPEYQAHANAVAVQYAPRLDELGSRMSDAIKPCDTPEVNAALAQVGLQ